MTRKIQQQIDKTIHDKKYQKLDNAIGTILRYDQYSNMATILISKSETDEAEEILKNVPCPTFIGIQMAAPEPGRVCNVIFRNGNITQPMIINYYNHRYGELDYPKQIGSQNNLPSYLLG